jgi:hypothetical protein
MTYPKFTVGTLVRIKDSLEKSPWTGISKGSVYKVLGNSVYWGKHEIIFVSDDGTQACVSDGLFERVLTGWEERKERDSVEFLLSLGYNVNKRI